MFACFPFLPFPSRWCSRIRFPLLVLLACSACQNEPPIATQPTVSPICQNAKIWPAILDGTSDIPTYPCMQQAVHIAAPKHPNSVSSGNILTFTTPDSSSTILATYWQRLQSAGWKLSSTLKPEGQSLTVEKPDVVYGDKDGYHRHIQITVMPRNEQLNFVIVAEEYELAVIVEQFPPEPAETPQLK